MASRSLKLDAVRGLAALSVFAYHAWLYTLPVVHATARHGTADDVMHELRLGLVLFFVLSGFLLYRPWAGGRAPRLREYARRRVARILPAYYVALVGSVVALWPLAGAPGVRLPPLSSLPLFAVFAQNFSGETVMKLDPPMWTLAVEATFYLALPLLGALALRLGRAAVPILAIAAGTLFNVWLAGRPPSLELSKTLAAMLPYFGCGMLAAVVARPRRGLAVAGALLVVADAIWHTTAAGPVSVIVRDLPAAAGFAAILASLRPTAPRALRPLAALGVVSYGFYLWHVPVLLVLRAHGLLPLNAAGATAVAGAVTLLLATASWRLVERPAIERAKRGGRVVPRHADTGPVRARVRPAGAARVPAGAASRSR